jgi:hypothetical protein
MVVVRPIFTAESVVGKNQEAMVVPKLKGAWTEHIVFISSPSMAWHSGVGLFQI